MSAWKVPHRPPMVLPSLPAPGMGALVISTVKQPPKVCTWRNIAAVQACCGVGGAGVWYSQSWRARPTSVSLEPRKGTCCAEASSARMHSFSASRLLLICAPSSRVCLRAWVRAQGVIPAVSSLIL
jgi:hypothetical protein